MSRTETARQAAQDARHDDRCPNCGRYVAAEADGFYDREPPYDSAALFIQLCDEACADELRAKDAAANVPRETLKS